MTKQISESNRKNIAVADLNSKIQPTILYGAVLDNLKMGYEKDNEEEPLRSL